jgi:hypothetical protein
MKATSQHEFHPDAERLSAFAEQALGEGERTELLRHLAACGRCRQVVASAQEAVESEIVTSAQRRPVIQPNEWWRQWRMVWVPTAIVGAFAVASISVYLRQIEQRQTAIRIAKTAPTEGKTSASPPPPAEQAEAAPPALPEPAPAIKSPSARNSGAAPGSRQRLYRGPSTVDKAESLNPPPPTPLPPPAPANLSQGFADEGFLAGGAPAVFKSSASAEWQAKQKEQDLEKQKAQARALHGALFAATAEPQTPSQGAERSAAEQVAVTAEQSEMRLAPIPHLEALQSARASVVVAGAPRIIHLPSGLPAISIANAGRVTLAIDKLGSLYISQDQGSTWDPVIQQWTGRAVLVRRRSAEPASAAPAPEAEDMGKAAHGASPAQPSPAGFEILNDQGQVWMSADGRIWTPK